MPSIFRRALGPDFDRLQPELQRRFSLSSRDNLAELGTGVMTSMKRGRLAAVPVAIAGRSRRLELPGAATDVRFDLANYAYLDGFGRETFLYSRRFRFPARVARFDDTMIYSESRTTIVNYLGSHQDIAAELRLSVTDDGGLRMQGGSQRIYLGRVKLALPGALAARAEVIERWDEAANRFTISVEIDSAAGSLFAYRGWFTVNEVPMVPQDIPAGLRPDRERRGD
ncbi:DUF4166 domain-containing protein [Jatrophihabitans telluris]|uniref:DUF4166 domain-containing protein n=1 Tax=Jatrophihabitans telluris TaxID=2038343 RepID=A0ABY4QVT6_9ACTN|nr:DUF4166 domain-containing protein [Jatrophihabitans telluris]UQX87247.1 DUF4166 domain-containing protein [Jatrophihabitans telluris]